MPLVSVCIINYNGARDIPRCIDAVLGQDHKDVEIIVVDNASTDDSRKVLQKYKENVNIILNDSNTGYCAAANAGLRISNGAYFICMNPDVFLEPGFISRALNAFVADPKTGSVTGKLLRFDEGGSTKTDIIDSTGIVINLAYRLRNRGSGEPDTGQYDDQREVFAVDGAAAMHRMEMLEEIKEGDEYFDELFFAYKEDADIAWRARKKGWRCRFVPDAVAYHVRNFQKGKRGSMPDIVRVNSFKNRYILLLKNLSGARLITNALFIIPFEIALFTYTLIFDRKLLKAYSFIISNIKAIIKKRVA